MVLFVVLLILRHEGFRTTPDPTRHDPHRALAPFVLVQFACFDLVAAVEVTEEQAVRAIILNVALKLVEFAPVPTQ